MNSRFELRPSLKHFAVLSAFLTLGPIGCAAAAATQCPSVTTPAAASAAQPLVVRAEAGSIWASPRVWAEPRRVWDMPARGPVEHLAQGAVTNGSGAVGYVVTFRQGGMHWRGELDADRQTCGELRPLQAPVERSTMATR